MRGFFFGGGVDTRYMPSCSDGQPQFILMLMPALEGANDTKLHIIVIKHKGNIYMTV